MDKLTPNLTEEQIKANIDSLVSQKADSSYIQSYIDNYKSDGRGGYVLKNQPVQQETPSVASEVKNAVSDTFVKPFTDRMSAVAGRAPNQSSVSTALQTVGAVAGGVSDIATTGLIEGAKVFTPKMVEDKISEYANKAGVTIAGKIPDSAKQFLADHPEALANAQAFIDIASVIPALKPVGQALAKGSKIGAEAAAIAGKNTAETISTVMTPSEKSLESKILTTFQKGVKPSIAGKKTTANVAQYKDNVISGVKTIKENAPNLTFTTDSGEAIIGQTPKTLQQFSDAIEQTKKSVFAKYDELAKKAGSAGVAVDVAPIARELDTVINDKALSITNPRAIQYAKDLQDRLIKTGKLDAVTAQDVIQQYNKSLEAFYRNPSYDTASQAAIDAAVANNMRKVLDNGITGLTGTEYGALKKQYGALKSIEQDVIKATLRDARKNTKGLIDFTDILSGSQLTHGLLTMNPATISSGLVSKGIATIHKTLNDPNRAISKMFDAASKIDKAKNASKIELNRGIIELNPKNWFEEVGNSADVGLKAKTKDLQLEMAQEAARTMRNHGVSVEVPTVKNAVQILEQARDIARKKKVSDVVKDVMPSEKMKPFLEPKKKVVSEPVIQYHYGSKIDSIDPSKFTTGIRGKGFYVTTDENLAKSFGGTKNEIVIDSNANIVKIEDKLPKQIQDDAVKKFGLILSKADQTPNTYQELNGLLDRYEMADFYKKHNVDGMIGESLQQGGKTETVIYNPEVIKVKPTPKAPTSLEQEAKKYKSAEEFVKAQGKITYRSTDKPFDKNLISERGIFTTPDKNYATNWKSGKGRSVEELIIDKKANILSKEKIPKEFYSTEDGIKYIKNEEDLIKYAKKNGFDGYENVSNVNGKDFEPEVVVFNKNMITTKTQLTDIWNKAHGK